MEKLSKLCDDDCDALDMSAGGRGTGTAPFTVRLESGLEGRLREAVVAVDLAGDGGLARDTPCSLTRLDVVA
jgi:hypothetical protein